LNRLSKVLLVLLLLVGLCACKTKQEDYEYIEPMRDAFLFYEVSDEISKRILQANNYEDYQNYQFQMWFKDIYDGQLTDIKGCTYELSKYDKLIIEVVSTTCNHCKRIIGNYLQGYLQAHPEICFIQYFNNADKQGILDFYQENNLSIPVNLIVVGKDEGFKKYIMEDLEAEYYPSLLCFLNGQLRYMSVGEIKNEDYEYVIDLGFNNPIEKAELVNSEGKSIFELARSYEDVRNDFSEENRVKIETLSSDLYTAELVYKMVGNTLDFDDLLPGNNGYVREIDDFSVYKDSQLIILYSLLKGDENDLTQIQLINDLIDSNNNYEYIVVLVDSYTNSSNIYRNSSLKFKAKAISTLSRMPADFYEYGMVAFPSAVFVNKGTFAGAYSKISDVESFNSAIEMFLSKDAIVYKKNNVID